MKIFALSVITAQLLACGVLGATFKVIAPGSTDVEVSVNGQRVKLTAKDPDIPYYIGDAPAKANAKYKYIVDGKEESFDRILEGESTRNDFYERRITYADIRSLPKPIKENPTWTRGGERGAIWDTNYIPTIFITGDKHDLKKLVKKAKKKKYSVKFTIIGPDDIHSFENCEFGIHGAGKKHNNAKQSWEWTLPEGQFLDNRNHFKLRHMEEDPTQMREKLYADILEAMGAPANLANMVRLYINGEPYGTFNMLDDIIQYSFIIAMFYNGHPPKQMGPLYDGASGADFGYHETDDTYYSWIPNPDSPHDSLYIEPLTKIFHDLNVKDDSEIESFDKKFDIDHFLRFMVMEYLTGSWDGYWMEQTNDGAYCDPTENNRWYYLGQDYDATFGVNLDEPEGRDFVKVSYKEFPDRYPEAVMINRLLENDKIREKFETYLKDTVEILFNNDTLCKERVLPYHEFILPDLQWDRSIEQRSPGINFGWTFDQVTENLWHGVSAPNNNGGGADWGLCEWIAAKEKAIRKEFSISSSSKSSSSPSHEDDDAAPAAKSDQVTPAADKKQQGEQAEMDNMVAAKSGAQSMVIIPGAMVSVAILMITTLLS